MYIVYQPNREAPKHYDYEEYFQLFEPSGPSACQWIVPGTVDPDDGAEAATSE